MKKLLIVLSIVSCSAIFFTSCSDEEVIPRKEHLETDGDGDIDEPDLPGLG